MAFYPDSRLKPETNDLPHIPVKPTAVLSLPVDLCTVDGDVMSALAALPPSFDELPPFEEDGGEVNHEVSPSIASSEPSFPRHPARWRGDTRVRTAGHSQSLFRFPPDADQRSAVQAGGAIGWESVDCRLAHLTATCLLGCSVVTDRLAAPSHPCRWMVWSDPRIQQARRLVGRREFSH